MASPFQFSFTNPVKSKNPFQVNWDELQTPDEENGVMNTQQVNPEPPHPQQNIMDAYREITQRQEGPSMSAYRKFLDTGYPKEEDYKPGKLTRLGAILSGAAAGFQNPASGYQVADKIISAPFEKAKERYEHEGARLQAGAALEETSRRNELSALSQAIERDQAERRLDSEIKNRNNLVLDRAERARRAGELVVVDAVTGHHLVKDRDTGQTISDLGKVDETPAEKSQRAVQQAVDIAKQTSPITEGRQKRTALFAGDISFGNAKRIEDIRQGNRRELADLKQKQLTQRIKLRTDEQIRRDAQKRGLAGTGSEVNQIRKNQQEVSSLYFSDPERWSKVFDIDPDTFRLKFANVPSADDPLYPDYVTMHNKLYAGTSTVLSDPRIVK